jgi:D-tagatose-1,6-bisphosphate aldolase subunit GatZ/KbaZ
MERARRLVHDCVAAGYQKIHLDASMPLGDDDYQHGLPKSVAAARSAELAATAEQALVNSGGTPPLYVIGTEVPVPGGSHSTTEELRITRPAEVEETIALTRREFQQRGLESAWERVIAVVVQPGVEFGDRDLHLYEAEKARALSRFIEEHDRLVYEAHSTDYQTRTALAQLVRDHFAILKVGPALTFAFREAVFALSAIEEAWLAGKVAPAALPLALEQAMMADPQHWQSYYDGDAQEQQFARRYSFSDRSRYYWATPRVSAALQQLLENLSAQPMPLTLLSQYLPQQYRRIRLGELANDPGAIIRASVADVLADYAFACGYVRKGNDASVRDGVCGTEA